jgi:nucleotide-binding universal stress UspA family protein
MTPASLMVRLTAGTSNDELLRFAVDCAGRLKPTQVIGISSCRPIQFYTTPDAYVPADMMDQDFEQIDKDLKEAERSFRSALEGKAKRIEWRSAVTTYGATADYVARQMRAADLLITPVEDSASVFGTTRHVHPADLALRIGRPVLVVGRGVEQLDLRHVVIAWKDTREARRAAEDALPILELADQVTVAEVADKDDLDQARIRTDDVAGWLGSHGIAASGRAVAAAGDDAAEMAAIARELRAGLVVGGAYGHTRLREWVLGGVTRDLLLRPARCSLVSH